MNTFHKFLIASAAAAPALALAHDGHGMPGAMHFHASDAWGFVMLAAVAVAVFLLARKK
jgi:hypothetical protein